LKTATVGAATGSDDNEKLVTSEGERSRRRSERCAQVDEKVDELGTIIKVCARVEQAGDIVQLKCNSQLGLEAVQLHWVGFGAARKGSLEIKAVADVQHHAEEVMQGAG
jgi:hypothetical protein